MPDDSIAEARSAPMPGSGAGPDEAGAGYGGVYRPDLDEVETIRRYAPMVKRLAGHLKGRLPETVQIDDLIQAGLIAVLRIARHGECPPEGPALRRSIVNAMIDEARRETWAPVRTVRLAKAAGRAMRAVKRRTGQDGSDDEIAAELRVPLGQYHRMLVEIAGMRLSYLDECDGGGGALQAADDQERALHQSRVLTALSRSIAALPDREKLVISLYYEHELNMDEVGKVLGLNKSTVCRAHGRALLMLRNELADWGDAADATRRAAGD